jgi:hypothetical protein
LATLKERLQTVMQERLPGKLLRAIAISCCMAFLAAVAVPAVKNMAVITSAGSKLSDVQLVELVKYCKGATKAWPDGKNFIIVMKNPDAPEMHGVLQKLFGASPTEARAAIAKLNESRMAVKVVESDEELLKTVESTPGAIGVVDVYSITSSVKVLRIDGKLPFDVGYPLKGN